MHLRLLAARRNGQVAVDGSVLKSLISRYPDVEARFMFSSDYRDLHDRHLDLTGGTGWVLPTCRVVMGVDRRAVLWSPGQADSGLTTRPIGGVQPRQPRPRWTRQRCWMQDSVRSQAFFTPVKDRSVDGRPQTF